jgi:hypothetical protein
MADAGMKTKGVSMHAKPGDHLVIQGHHVGETNKEGEILEVRGAGGEPPFLVRWSDDEHETLVFPGSDAVVQHLRRKASKKTA